MKIEETWNLVDRYIVETVLPQDSVLESVLRANANSGLPPHDVSPAQGRFLELLVRAAKANAILEIGTLGGYSTIWLARGLGFNGRIVTLEVNSKHADAAEKNLRLAGVEKIVTVRRGPAFDILQELIANRAGPFDFIFIDADKVNSVDYFNFALKLSRPGTVIVADNTVRNGDLADANSSDPSVRGVRRLHEFMSSTPSVIATTLQTVGCKGYDGFTLALVINAP